MVAPWRYPGRWLLGVAFMYMKQALSMDDEMLPTHNPRQPASIQRWWGYRRPTMASRRLTCHRQFSLLRIAVFRRHGNGVMCSNASLLSGSHRFTSFWDTYQTLKCAMHPMAPKISKALWIDPHYWASRHAHFGFSASTSFARSP